MLPIFKECGGEVAVVGEQNEATGSVFEITDGIDTRGKSAERVDERFAAFGVRHGSDDVDRLVECKVDVIFGRGDEFAGGFDLVGGEIGFRAEFRDDFAVNADLATANELLRVSARGDAGS